MLARLRRATGVCGLRGTFGIDGQIKAVSHSARNGLICLAIAWGVMLYKWRTNTIPPTHFQLTRIIQAAPRRPPPQADTAHPPA